MTSGYSGRISGQGEINAMGVDLFAKPFKREQLAAAIKKSSV
ncbi:MAG: hypothetical protein V7722_06045 [Porticoccus sp.]